MRVFQQAEIAKYVVWFSFQRSVNRDCVVTVLFCKINRKLTVRCVFFDGIGNVIEVFGFIRETVEIAYYRIYADII